MHLLYRVSLEDSYTEFDLEANGVAIKRLTISYQASSRLEFTVTAAEHTSPIPANAEVLLWDSVGLDPAGTAFSEANPLFIGIVNEIRPGDHSNQVIYVCNDPTYNAAKTVTVMSLPYDTGADNPADGAVPRLVVNCKNTSDDDYAYSFGQDLTVGDILEGLLDFTKQPLRALGAAPASGDPYDSTETALMTFKPQQKVVFESLTIKAAIDQVWRHEPRFRPFWNPVDRKTHFHRLYAGTTKTLKLNDFGWSGSDPKPYVLVGLEITPNYQDCYGAVKIYGPPSPQTEEFTWEPGIDGLSADGTNIIPISSPVIVESYSDSGGMHDAVWWAKWQIFDADKRPGAKLLPEWRELSIGNYAEAVRWPIVLVSWDEGVTWYSAKGIYIDYLNGIIEWKNGIMCYVTQYDNNVPMAPVAGSTQTKFTPNRLKLVWAPYAAALNVRYPSTGFSGTAYSQLGMERELKLYDESLAIGREYGTPVTSVERQAQFATIAEYLQEVRRDVVYTGQAVLTGCDYSYCRLGCRVNLEDEFGETTGWEAIDAIVTDVEYVYGDSPSTNLSFSSNWAELYGEDPAALRERLRVKTFEQMTYAQLMGSPRIDYQYRPYTNFDGSVSQMVTGGLIYNPFVYYDPETGKSQMGTIR